MFSCHQFKQLICSLVGLKDLVEKHFRGLAKRRRGALPSYAGSSTLLRLTGGCFC